MTAAAEQDGSERGDHIEEAIGKREAIQIVLARVASVLIVPIIQGASDRNPAIADGAKCGQRHQAAV